MMHCSEYLESVGEVDVEDALDPLRCPFSVAERLFPGAKSLERAVQYACVTGNLQLWIELRERMALDGIRLSSLWMGASWGTAPLVVPDGSNPMFRIKRFSPIHQAMVMGHVDLVRTMLNMVPSPEDLPRGLDVSFWMRRSPMSPEMLRLVLSHPSVNDELRTNVIYAIFLHCLIDLLPVLYAPPIRTDVTTRLLTDKRLDELLVIQSKNPLVTRKVHDFWSLFLCLDEESARRSVQRRSTRELQ